MPLSRVPKSVRPASTRPAPQRMLSSQPQGPSPRQPESSLDVLALQQSLGNRAVQRLLSSRSIQAKLQVGLADDVYEQEADKVAARVLSGGPQTDAGPAGGGVESSTVQPKSASAASSGFDAGSGVESRIQSSKGSGGALDEGTRGFMESRFGADFSGVRIHTGSDAAQLNRAVQADAFTHGQDIYFNTGKFSPSSQAGRQLLAHELTHVVQQGSASQVRRQASVQVQQRLPANRLSTKKQKMYLDFVRMKRLDPQFSKIIGKKLGLKKMAEKSGDQSGGTYGHWWTEIGDMTGDYPGTWEPAESYGWWPKNGLGGLKETFKGVEGALNAGEKDDPHHGEDVSASQMFHPVMEVDSNADYEKVREKVITDIRSNSKSYKGKWAWRFGWGQNCHTFQQWLKKKVGIHHQKGVGWFKRPDHVEGIAAAAAKQKKQEKQEAFDREHPGANYKVNIELPAYTVGDSNTSIPVDSVIRVLDDQMGGDFTSMVGWGKAQFMWEGQYYTAYKDDILKASSKV